MSAAAPDLQIHLDRFDRARLGGFHARLLLLVGLCWLWAAFGVSIIGYVLPPLKSQWGLSSSQEGLIASTGLVGMMIGAVLAGGLADRIGRRQMLALTMLWLGVFSGLTALAPGYPALLILRLLAGLGLGAVLPVASTLVSEYSPARYRGSLLVLLNGFWGLGSALAALAGYELVTPYGWQSALLFGALAIASAPAVRILLPESMRFWMSKGRLAEALAAARQIRVTAAESAPAPAVPRPAPAAGQPASPFSPPYRGRTASLTILWIALNFTFQGVFLWLPSILIAGGNSVSQSYLFSLIISLGQVPGTLLAAALADRASRRLTFGLCIVFWGIAVFFFGMSRGPAAVLGWGFLLAVGSGAAWGLAYPFTTELYPTRMRGFATGWATGVGRVGGILAPYLVGVFIQAGIGEGAIFGMLSAAPVLAALSLASLRQETTGRALEEISRE